jgi:hypothetical protein
MALQLKTAGWTRCNAALPRIKCDAGAFDSATVTASAIIQHCAAVCKLDPISVEAFMPCASCICCAFKSYGYC